LPDIHISSSPGVGATLSGFGGSVNPERHRRTVEGRQLREKRVVNVGR